MIKKGSKFSNGYAMVTDLDGGHLRIIAEIMTEMGYKKNHSTVRNHVLGVIYKFAQEYSKANRLNLSEEKLKALSISPLFQSGFCDVLHKLEETGQWPVIEMKE